MFEIDETINYPEYNNNFVSISFLGLLTKTEIYIKLRSLVLFVSKHDYNEIYIQFLHA